MGPDRPRGLHSIRCWISTSACARTRILLRLSEAHKSVSSSISPPTSQSPQLREYASPVPILPRPSLPRLSVQSCLTSVLLKASLCSTSHLPASAPAHRLLLCVSRLCQRTLCAVPFISCSLRPAPPLSFPPGYRRLRLSTIPPASSHVLRVCLRSSRLSSAPYH